MRYAIIGSGKIGTALARTFARKKIEVAIANSRGPRTLASLARELGPTVSPQSVEDASQAETIFLAVPFPAHMDVAKKFEQWNGKIVIDATNALDGLVADTVAKFGKLDVLVNNAAFAIFGPFEKTTTEDWRKVMATDLDSVFFATREALPHLLKTKGSVINLSSASGLGGDWGLSSYNAAKGGVTNFTCALALEYGSRGVRINAVAPSLTSTEATAEIEKSEAVMVAFRERLPIGRAATPEEVAGVIAFLASEDALFVNGAILSVDGGLHASNGQPNFLSLLGAKK